MWLYVNSAWEFVFLARFRSISLNEAIFWDVLKIITIHIERDIASKPINIYRAYLYLVRTLLYRITSMAISVNQIKNSKHFFSLIFFQTCKRDVCHVAIACFSDILASVTRVETRIYINTHCVLRGSQIRVIAWWWTRSECLRPPRRRRADD